MRVLNNIIDVVDAILDKVASPVYNWLIALFYFIYIATFFGIFHMNVYYLHYLSVFIQVFIATILILRFNPLRKHVLRESDNVIIFASALFLLMNVGFTETTIGYMKKVWNNVVKPDIREIISI